MSRSDKRRLNYITAEDFYFLTYEILITLNSMVTTSGATFKDHRKLAYLVHIISDSRLISILERNRERKIVSAVDKELLFSSFTAGELHKREVYKIILALQKKEYVNLSKGSQAEVLDVKLNKGSLPKEFLASEKFASDHNIADRLKKVIPRISSMSLETFLSRAYKDYGLNVWAC